uniref:Uncharacterized protein n=1 Tax=Glossina palpalis gambiensis TaxID=67801 RepID=A0A1B0BF06_9MUSC
MLSCVVCLVSFTGDLSLKINVNKLIRNIEMANAELTKPTHPIDMKLFKGHHIVRMQNVKTPTPTTTTTTAQEQL